MASANVVEIFANGSSKGTATADGSGNWSKTITLSANDYNLKAKATDPAGNTSGFSGLRYIRTGDTTKPARPDLLDDSGSSSTDNITNDATPRISVELVLDYVDDVVLSSTAVKGMSLEHKVGSGSYSQIVSKNNADLTITDNPSGSDKKFSFTHTCSTLASGSHTFRTRWTDQNNSTSQYSQELSITIDTTAPNAPAITSVTNGAVIFGTSVAVSGTSS